MEKFDVYIDAVRRDNNAKVDLGVVFVKEDVTWYRFARKVVDKWKLSTRAGHMKAIMLAIEFANKHDLFITINLSNGKVMPENIKGLMKTYNKSSMRYRTYNNEFCLEYLQTLEKYSANYELVIVKGENQYHEYLRKIAKNKFKNAV